MHRILICALPLADTSEDWVELSQPGREELDRMSARRRLFAIATLALSLAACRDSKVTSYRVPKEKDSEPPAAAADASQPGSMAGTAVATSNGESLTWTTPATWKPKTGASAMRKASLAIPGEGGPDGDFAITAFPGDVGGEAANLNRWRGQVGLPPLSNGEIEGLVTRFSANGLNFAVVDFTNPAAEPASQHLLAALVPYAGSTWFFKLLGPDPTVAGEKPAFLAFLKTVTAPAAP